MTISYEYGNALYINLTNRCDCACVFCIRQNGSGGSIYASNLWLEREPTADEAIADLLARDLSSYSEIVYCGFGEPTYRLDDIIKITKTLREKLGDRLPRVRINTNGHADLINGRRTEPELAGVIDALSISLNAPDAEKYVSVTRPKDGVQAYEAMLDFTREAAKYVPDVMMTVVSRDLSESEIKRCREITDSLGVRLRVREYIEE